MEETLNEEKDADGALSGIAQTINVEASEEDEEEMEEAGVQTAVKTKRK